MAKRKSTSDPESPQPSFEEALAGLESIVEAMESEALPLEELVAHYEKGSELLARCESLLKSARGRIELITLRRQQQQTGDDPSPQAPSLQADTSADDADEIRLF
ncbi:MAG: exodeoxyribonuclease VII small subunit [Verrucomicrobia bacterium]|jgi:exodeoxyribonuclease VII small subunit|nr:exodeoxyribonuclease VII small subunit [Verrucomicrobiota bacterium]